MGEDVVGNALKLKIVGVVKSAVALYAVTLQHFADAVDDDRDGKAHGLKYRNGKALKLRRQNKCLCA